MRKSSKKVMLLPLLGLILTGCKGAVAEVYNQGQFHTDDFVLNYYTAFPSELNAVKYTNNEKVFNLTKHDYRMSLVNHLLYNAEELNGGKRYSRAFDDAVWRDYGRGLISFEDMVNTYGDDKAKGYTAESIGSSLNNLESFLEIMRSSINNSWKNYGLRHRLSSQHLNDERINNYFKYGVFSKLTEGLLECDGSGSLVRVQIKEEGIGKKLDYELVDYHSLTLSLRGGTNIAYDNALPRVPNVDILLKVSFYIEETISNEASKVTLNIPIENLESDNSSRTNIIQIYFDEIPGFTEGLIKRANALSIGFELLDHDIIKPNGVFDPNSGYEFAVMLYEVMFPYSIWN